MQRAFELEYANLVHLGKPGALVLRLGFGAAVIELYVVGNAFLPNKVQRITLFDFQFFRVELQLGHRHVDGLSAGSAELGLSWCSRGSGAGAENCCSNEGQCTETTLRWATSSRGAVGEIVVVVVEV